MDRTLLLTAHIACAVSLVGNTLAARQARGGVRTASDLAGLRGALDVLRRGAQANPALALVVLATGVLLARHGLWQLPWFWVAVGLWLANLVLAVGVVVPAAKRLGAAAAQAGDGPVPEAVDRLRTAAGPATAQDLMIGLDLGMLAMMVAKPGLGAALAWPLLGRLLALLVALAPRLRMPARARSGLGSVGARA